jgi:hypothetical protein
MKRSMFYAGVLSMVFCAAGLANSLTGTVFDATSSAPIGGAIVSTHILIPDSIGIFDTTDASGRYDITGIPPGNQIYVIMASASGYRHYYFRFDDLGSGSFEFDILLDHESSPPPGGGDSTGVGGRILGHSGTTSPLVPIGGATVSFSSAGKTYTATTGPNGEYRINIPPGGYSVSVSAQGYSSSASSGVSVGAGGLSYGSVLQSTATSLDDRSTAALSFALNEAYPNPFNPSTTISFVVAEQGWVTLRLYDLLGREVSTLASGVLPAGPHRISLNAAGLSSGVYFVRLTSLSPQGTERFSATRRLMLLR